jgi:hypothetical protein
MEWLPVIAATLHSSTVGPELLKVKKIGSLATAIFDRVARSEDPARGIFSAEAAAGYGEAISREVRVEEIQPVVNEMLAAKCADTAWPWPQLRKRSVRAGDLAGTAGLSKPSNSLAKVA